MLHTCTFQSMYTISILSPSRIFVHIPCDVEGATHYMEYILYVTVVVCPAPLLSGGGRDLPCMGYNLYTLSQLDSYVQ